MFTSTTRPRRLRTSVDQGAYILTLWLKTLGKKIKFKMSLFVIPPLTPHLCPMCQAHDNIEGVGWISDLFAGVTVKNLLGTNGQSE